MTHLAQPSLPILETPRLRLRPLVDADVPALFAIFSDPQVMRYWSSAPLPDEAAAQALLDRIHDGYAKQIRKQWGIERRADGQLLGTCSLGHHDVQNRRAEVGYILGRAYWGQGWMQEALTEMLRHAFAPVADGGLNMHRLEADIDPRNHASRRSLEKLGFQREGYLRERWHVAGEVCDTELYGLLRSEWQVEKS
jgi:[ribosomal protein S5]-alanine N-acetyltransferase